MFLLFSPVHSAKFNSYKDKLNIQTVCFSLPNKDKH